jgi:hypothetical protein
MISSTGTRNTINIGRINQNSEDPDLRRQEERIAYLPTSQPSTKIQDINPKEVDALLTKELNELSIFDRQRVLEELHGVHRSAVEHQESTKLQACLDRLDAEIDKIPASEKVLYNEAVRNNSPYILSEQYRTKFARAGKYDPEDAAKRIVSNLQFVYDLFGSKEAGLIRPVLHKDLSENAQRTLQRGPFRSLPFRDPSGRRIIVVLGECGSACTSKEKVCPSYVSL